MITEQMRFWSGDFGAEYTERNNRNPNEYNEMTRNYYGISREEMNREFLLGLNIERILEVGCNIGCQLKLLQNMGYKNLYGLELQWGAIEKAKSENKLINFIQGSAFDLPFKDGYFDLVFTSGVLIHIAPEDIFMAMDEIYRTSSKYIWGFEYYSDEIEHVVYHGHQQKMWKANYMKIYLERYPDLRVVKERKIKYLQNDNVDQMFLLKKGDI